MKKDLLELTGIVKEQIQQLINNKQLSALSKHKNMKNDNYFYSIKFELLQNVRETDLYKNIVHNISEKYNIDSSDAGFILLYNFIDNFFTDYCSLKLSDQDSINKYTDMFIDYLETMPEKFELIADFDGIHCLNIDEIIINDDFKILPGNRIFKAGNNEFRNVLCKLIIHTHNSNTAQKIVNDINDLFSLYKLGYISVKEKYSELDNYISLNKSDLTSALIKPERFELPDLSNRYQYVIDKNSVESIKTFFKSFYPSLSQLDVDHPIRIAINFYREALSKESISAEITYAVMSLEALYNTGSTEIKRTLKQRASTLMGTLHYINPDKYSQLEPINKILSDLDKAYGVRCAYVHGVNPEKTKDTEMAERILNYAKASIKLFLQLISLEDTLHYKDLLIEESREAISVEESKFELTNDVDRQEEIKKEIKKLKDKIKEIRKSSSKNIINDYILDRALIDKNEYESLIKLIKQCLIP